VCVYDLFSCICVCPLDPAGEIMRTLQSQTVRRTSFMIISHTHTHTHPHHYTHDLILITTRVGEFAH